MTYPMTRNARLAAALIALIALISLAFQVQAEWIAKGDQASVLTVIWPIMRYFTHLTNALVVIVLGACAWRGTWGKPAWIGALAVWTVALGVVYHILLSATHNPIGLEIWASYGEHSIVPLASLIFWAVAAPKVGLSAKHAVIWTAWPLGYAVYAILRGLAEGKYPYFFLDPVKSGWGLVGGYVVGLGVFFVGCGLILVWLAKILRRPLP